MAETDLNIILRMIDNASEDFKRINSQAIDQVNQLRTTQSGASAETSRGFKEVGAKATEAKEKVRTFGEQVKESSKHLRQLRQSLFIVTAALAVMIKGLNDAAEYNQEAKNTLDGFTRALKTLSAVIGTTFEPAIRGLTFVIDGFRLTIESALSGFIKLFSFVFEFLAQLPSAFKNIFDNIKNIFTKNEDPIGIVEGFRKSFQRALEIANIATDQILGKIEGTRARIESGRTIKKEQEDLENLDKIKIKTAESTKKQKFSVDALSGALGSLRSSLAQAGEANKGFAKASQAIAIALAIINTAQGVTRAFKDYMFPFSLVVGGIIAAAGAIEIATISAQKFHSGGIIKAHDGLAVDEVPIIAQTGEGILSRKGMKALGGNDRLNQLNEGKSSGSSIGDIFLTINYPRMSSRDEAESLAGVLGNELQRQLRYARGF